MLELLNVSPNPAFFGTITTPYNLTLVSARRLGEKIGRFLSKTSGNFESYYWVAEKHKNGTYHLHTLLHRSPSFAVYETEGFEEENESLNRSLNTYLFDVYRRLSNDGFCKSEVSRSQNSTAEYVTKYITKNQCDYDYYKLN